MCLWPYLDDLSVAVAAAAAATPVAVATTNAGSGQAATHHLYLQVRRYLNIREAKL